MAASLPIPAARQRFRRRLLAWYRANGRELPWRCTTNPYHILVSEIMLQQTQVDRVLPKYHEWLAKYPSLAALAAAAEDEVAETWRPLGYNIRPRRLQSIARESVERYGGQLPSDHDTLLSFKGIGAYTAGAIRSFAFGQRAAILDTNVARVLYRVFVGRGDIKAHRMRKRLWRLSEALVPYKHAFDFNQALMDLGATVCTARKPACGACPMAPSCVSFPRLGPQGRPTTSATATVVRRSVSRRRKAAHDYDEAVIVVVAAVIENDDTFLVTRRQAGVHLAGLWEFPGGKIDEGETHAAALAREIREELGAEIDVGELVLHVTHPYEDRTVALYFYRCSLRGEARPLLGQEMRWARRADLATLGFPPADEALITLLRGSGARSPSPARGQ